MGMLRKLNRATRKAMHESAYGKIAKEVQRMHAEYPMAEWQRGRISEIRALYEHKRQNLADKHEQLQAGLSAEFMQHEIEFIRASHQFRQDNPGKEWHPGTVGKMGFMARSFWKKLMTAVPSLSHGATSEA